MGDGEAIRNAALGLVAPWGERAGTVAADRERAAREANPAGRDRRRGASGVTDGGALIAHAIGLLGAIVAEAPLVAVVQPDLLSLRGAAICSLPAIVAIVLASRMLVRRAGDNALAFAREKPRRHDPGPRPLMALRRAPCRHDWIAGYEVDPGGEFKLCRRCGASRRRAPSLH
jgi:hypothetical protein